MGRWQQLSGPKTILSISAANDGWLLGTDEGAWMFDPADPSCKIVAESLRPAMVSAVALAGHRLFVGAADGMAFSDDNGATWQQAALPGKLQVSQIVASPNVASDGVLFAATLQGGVLCTRNGGDSWGFANLGLSDAEAVALALSPEFPSDQTAVVAVGTGAFISQNLGRTWRVLGVEAAAAPVSGFAFSRQALLVGSESKGLYHSIDGGKSFSKREAFSSGPVNSMAVSPDGTLIALATPSVVALSRDYGATWQRTEGRTPRSAMSLAIDNDGRIVCGTQRDQLWYYTA
jgi:photosystem II stability/assembly factor-like uncharacterized protein